MLEQFHFLRPWWLLLIVGALGVWWWKSRKGVYQSNWNQVVDAHLLPHLLNTTKKIHKQRLLWLPLFLTLVALALAGPTFEQVKSSSNLVGKPLIVVLDLSQHMLSTDISPSRIKRALFKLKDLLASQKEHEVALIAFAGDAHVVAPLTLDHKTILMLSESLGPDTMPIEGSRLLTGLKEAASMSTMGADIIVITSTNVEESALSLVKFIDQQRLKVIFWSFATEAGAPILGRDGRFDATRTGSVTISSLQHEWLKELEKNSNVHHVAVTADDSDQQEIIALLGNQFHESNKEESVFDTWHDLGPHVLVLAMMLFLMASFLGGTEWLMLCLLLCLPTPKAEAALSDWFMRSDQKAYQALQENKPDEAAKLYADDFSKGTAFYKAKNYEEAAKYLSSVNTSDGRYNFGNALAHLNKISEAIQAYNEALKLNPKNADAQYNKEILEKLMKEQEKKKQDSKDQKDEQKENSEQQQEEKKEKTNPSNEQDQSGSNDSQPKNQESQDSKKTTESKGSKSEEQSVPEQKQEQSSQPKSQPGETEQQKVQASEQESIDPNTRHQLQHLENNNNNYLKRKFREESRRKSEAR